MANGDQAQILDAPIPRELNSAIAEAEESRVGRIGSVPGSFDDFFAALIEESEDMLENANGRREHSPRFFGEKNDRNRRRSNNAPEFVADEYGRIARGVKDGHLKMGFGMGWTASAIYAAADHVGQTMFETTQRPYRIRSRGRREEAMRLANALTWDADELYRMADMKRVGKRRSYLSGRDGTAILRYYPVARLVYARNPETGAFEESREDVEPFVALWPIEDVLFSTPEKPEAWDQEQVFWVTRNATVGEIEFNEATFDIFEGDDQFDRFGGVSLKLSGRFFNLERLRGLISRGSASQTGERIETDTQIHTQSSRVARLSAQNTIDLVEVEGRLPGKMVAWIEEDLFTWRHALSLGIDVGVPEPQTDDEKREFAARMLRLPYFRWSYAIDRDSNSHQGRDNSLRGVPLEFAVAGEYDPKSISRRNNSAFIYKYSENGNELYGHSIADLGHRIEDVADLLINCKADINNFNANPAILSNRRSKLIKRTKEEARRLLTPNANIEVNADLMDINQVIQIARLEDPRGIDELIPVLKLEFETATGVLAAAKTGPSGEKTLGALQISESKATARLNSVIIQHAREDARLLKAMIEDQVKIRGREGFIEWTAKAAGRDAVKLEQVVPSIDGLWEEIEIDHPLTFSQDRIVTSQRIIDGWTAFGGPLTHDTRKTATLFYELGGFAHPEDIMLDGYDILEPREKYIQMSQGNWVEPNPNMPPMDLIAHLSADQAMLIAIANGQSGFDDFENVVLFDLLVQHMRIEQRLLQNLLQFGLLGGGMGGGLNPVDVGPGILGQGGGPTRPQTQTGRTPGGAGDQRNAIANNSGRVAGRQMANAASA